MIINDGIGKWFPSSHFCSKTIPGAVTCSSKDCTNQDILKKRASKIDNITLHQ